MTNPIDATAFHHEAISAVALWAGLSLILLLVLTIRVSLHRRSLKVSLGDGGHAALNTASRTFGNAVEYLPIGRYVYAVGGNEDAAILSGIRTARIKLMVYAVSGFTAAIAGMIQTSRLLSGQPNSAIGVELDAIAAVVLGGTAITGGRGHIVGTLIGALLLGVLNNSLNMIGLSPYSQRVVKGVILLVAVLIGYLRKQNSR